MTAGTPIWVRVSGIIAFVLVGVVVGSMLLGGSSLMRGMDQNGGGMDHNGSPSGSAAPSQPVPTHVRPGH